MLCVHGRPFTIRPPSFQAWARQNGLICHTREAYFHWQWIAEIVWLGGQILHLRLCGATINSEQEASRGAESWIRMK